YDARDILLITLEIACGWQITNQKKYVPGVESDDPSEIHLKKRDFYPCFTVDSLPYVHAPGDFNGQTPLMSDHTEADHSDRLDAASNQVGLWRHTGAWRGREGAPYSTLVPSDEVTVNYRHGLPVITLMLPTRSERCQFTVKPIVTTVGAFLQDVQREDKGIERAEVFATDGSKVSDATLMEVLLMNDFKLVINNRAYSVSPPVKDKLSSEHATEMEDIKSLVHRLFVALHLEDHQIRKERELLQKLDHLKGELLPLEQMKAKIMDSADAKTSRLLWVGLALMSTQGGALAWLTWWVYSWDIMEPVTYFITYGSAMAFYAYFVLTKQDYIYPHAKDRQFLHYFYRKSKKHHFNVEQYNKLKDDLAEEQACSKIRLRPTGLPVFNFVKMDCFKGIKSQHLSLEAFPSQPSRPKRKALRNNQMAHRRSPFKPSCVSENPTQVLLR
ncbi:Calcium uniporter regulatory subunit MCUb, partial [Lamprotornis superbus]